MSSAKVAVVTGANKGIGYATVKGLCQRFQGTVYLTARNAERGQAAVAELKKLGFNPRFHQLDITDQQSINKFKEHITQTHGGIDILINNAGIMYAKHTPGKFVEETEKIMKVNYFGLLKLSQSLFPILRNNARVVNISGRLGHLSVIPSAEIRAKFSDPNLTIPELDKLINSFLKDMKENKNTELWGTVEYKDYNVSKVGVSALTFIQQKEFDREVPNRNISVNCVHPGLVATDMNNSGQLTANEGASTPLYVALDAQGLKGKFVWFDKSLVDWSAPISPEMGH